MTSEILDRFLDMFSLLYFTKQHTFMDESYEKMIVQDFDRSHGNQFKKLLSCGATCKPDVMLAEFDKYPGSINTPPVNNSVVDQPFVK